MNGPTIIGVIIVGLSVIAFACAIYYIIRDYSRFHEAFYTSGATMRDRSEVEGDTMQTNDQSGFADKEMSYYLRHTP